jgi:hypothetical protein
MDHPEDSTLEADPRFPSGPWTGFFLMPHTGARRHRTSLRLTFTAGRMSGDGRDSVGKFTIDGSYDVESGKCIWVKQYHRQHAVYYDGYNEGKGIWGMWNIPQSPPTTVWRGGFHIWPEGFPDPTVPHLETEADEPVTVGELLEVG